MYDTIVNNGVPLKASPKALREHVWRQVKGKPSVSQIYSWSPEKAAEVGVYKVRTIRSTPLAYQKVSTGPLVFSGGEVTRTDAASDIPLDTAKELAKGTLASNRYKAEVGGITVGETPVDTDRETQSKLIAARVLAKENDQYSVTWKTSAGFVVMDAATIISVADAVAAHVQSCFITEAYVSDSIDQAENVSALRLISLDF